MTLPSPSECARWYERAFGCDAVVMVEGRGETPHDEGNGGVRPSDALTTLRWISRPAADRPCLLALASGEASALVFHLGADQLTGRVRLGPLSDDDPPVADRLALLGLAAGDGGGEPVAVVDQGLLASALMFAVVPEDEAPGSEPERPPAPAPDELPLDIYASGFIGLATQFGAPLESIWHHMWESSGVRWCLLNADLEVEDVNRIPYRQLLSAEDFVRALRACSEGGLRFLGLPVCVTTGPGNGHVIHIESIDDHEVVYHDPWPGRSLLAAGNNSVGIAARPWEGPARRWCISVGDLQRVGYASLVEPAVWLPLCGVSADVSYRELSGSEFFGFFHLAETGRSRDDETGLTLIGVEPGNWQEQISLSLTVDAEDAVRSGVLMVDRSWLTAPATAPFAADLLTHFVRTLVTEADADEAELLCDALRSIPTGGVVEALAAGPAHLLNQFRLVAMTVAGAAPFARATLPCSTVRVLNGTTEAREPQRPRLIVAVSRPRYESGVIFEDHETGYLMDEYREFLWRRNQKTLA